MPSELVNPSRLIPSPMSASVSHMNLRLVRLSEPLVPIMDSDHTDVNVLVPRSDLETANRIQRTADADAPPDVVVRLDGTATAAESIISQVHISESL